VTALQHDDDGHFATCRDALEGDQLTESVGALYALIQGAARKGAHEVLLCWP